MNYELVSEFLTDLLSRVSRDLQQTIEQILDWFHDKNFLSLLALELDLDYCFKGVSQLFQTKGNKYNKFHLEMFLLHEPVFFER